MPRVKFTLANIKSKCLPPPDGAVTRSGTPITQVIYWSTDQPGLGLIVRRPRPGGGVNATWVLQREVRGKVRKIKIGRFGPWTIDDAMTRARELIVSLDRDEVDPAAEKAKVLTLGEAVAIHGSDMRKKGRSPRSIESFEHETKKYLKDWLERPLVSITREECRSRHERMTADHGAFIANRVVGRHLRAAWNSAARIYEALPPRCPTVAVVLNPEPPSEKRIEWAELPGWWRMVEAIRNPVRRDLQRFILLTGLRSQDAASVRWSEIDFEKGTIHRPSPKGGRRRRFTVPLAAWVLAMLQARRDENRVIFGDDGGWVFPTRDRDGKVVRVVRVQSDVPGKGRGLLPGPHALRHTFLTAAMEAGLQEVTVGVLANHVMPRGSVTRRYLHPSVEHLRDGVERVVGFLLAKAGVVAERREVG